VYILDFSCHLAFSVIMQCGSDVWARCVVESYISEMKVYWPFKRADVTRRPSHDVTSAAVERVY